MRIIISNCTGLGNIILKGKMIDYLYKNNYKDIILLNDNRWGYSELIKKDQRQLKIKHISISCNLTSIRKLLKLIKQRKKDIIILPFDSSPLYVSIFFSIFSNGKIYIHKHNKNFFSINIYLLILRLLRIGRHLEFIKIEKGTHEEEINLSLISRFINLKKDYSIFKRGLRIKLNKNIKDRIIVIQASAKNGEATPKICNPNKLRSLIKFINSNYKEYKVIMVGDKNEKEYINKIIKDRKAINKAGSSSIIEFYESIISANLVICHDSSAMHIADTNNIPCIALLGPTDFSRTGPKSSNTIPVVSVNQSTMYMYNLEEDENTTIRKFGTKFCMENINFDIVKAAIQIILDKNNAI